MSPRVLIVDDDPTFVGFVFRVIESRGICACVAVSGGDALSQLSDRAQRFSGILLDLKLPDIHGVEVLRRIRRSGIDTPVAVLTGNGDVSTAVAAMKLGAVEFVEKPVLLPTLEQVLNTLTAGGAADYRPTDRPTEGTRSLAEFSPRTLRIANVVARFVDAPSDARTVDAFCRASGLFLADRTFRGWCRAEGIEASALHDLARVLRASRHAEQHDCVIEACLDGDVRSIAALLARGGLTQWIGAARPRAGDILLRQQYVTARPVVEAVRILLS